METLPSIEAILAYFDPGSGSLVLQAIVGGTAGLMVLAKYVWDTMPAVLRKRKSADATDTTRR